MPAINKTNKPAAAAAPTPAASTVRRASSNPDTMVSAGLASKFWGTLIRSWYRPEKYGKGPKAGKWYAAHYYSIQADDSSLGKDGIVTERTRVADLTQWVPSMDGETPAGCDFDDYTDLANGRGEIPAGEIENFEGVYLIGHATGTQSGLPRGTKHEQWVKAAKDCGIPVSLMGEDIRWPEGVRAYWDRMPYTTQDGKPLPVEEGQEARSNDTLVMVEVDKASLAGGGASAVTKAAATPAPAAATKAAPKPAATSTKAAGAAASNGDLDARIEAAIFEVVVEHGAVNADTGLVEFHKNEVATKVADRFEKLEKAKAVGKLRDNGWMTSRETVHELEGVGGVQVAYDPDSGNVVLVPTEAAG